MSTKIRLEWRTSLDPTHLAHGLQVRIIRLFARVSFRELDDWSRPWLAIMDIGSPITLLPKPVWETIHVKKFLSEAVPYLHQFINTNLSKQTGGLCYTGMTRPNRQYNTGMTNKLSIVELKRPPRMTTAIGCSISWPGRLPPTTMGSNAKAAASAVMRIGARRSCAPRKINSRLKDWPSSLSKWR